MKSLLRLVAAMSRTERIALGVLLVFTFGSFLLLLRSFHRANTEAVAVRGGTYIEGSVGEVLPMNPWFVTGNDTTRDITSLVFSGLMKYDPRTGKVVDDLGTVRISDDYRTYTATLKPNIFWHDSSAEKAHPVTADDILFTFQSIQEQGFSNPILKQNFRGVTIEKIDDRTVRFRLSKPYSFFSSNLTLGIVPKASFEGVKPEHFHETLDFGFHPIGAGPYAFQSLLQTDLSTEVTLKRFERQGLPPYNIERVVFRVFPDYSTLLTDILNMDAVRGVPRNPEGQPILPKKFRPAPYTLPQYVGLFMNLDRTIMGERNVRLGLQLATNKKAIVDIIRESHIVDTPLLEIDLSDWQYRYDDLAAQGAFFESNWHMPEKLRLQRLLEQRETNRVGPLKQIQHIALIGTGAQLTVTGSLQNLSMPLFLNSIAVSTGSVKLGSGSAIWTVKLPAGSGMSGSLKVGTNILKLTDKKGDIVDSAYIERFTSTRAFALASEEQRLIERFLATKTLPDSDSKKVTVNSMYLEYGFLREKKTSDLPHIRQNGRGKELTITLLTSPSPSTYGVVARELKKQWEAVGVGTTIIIPETRREFEEKLLRREYDIVLFGESLLDNLDSYPYWHSSQMQEREDPTKLRLDALNLSQYASFDADLLLARIRETGENRGRAKALRELQELFKKDIPAIVLYSPLHVLGVSETVRGVTLEKLSLHADRFGHFNEWYVSTRRRFKEGKSWFSFFGWTLGLL